MKKIIDIFNKRRRRLADNNQGIAFLGMLALIGAGIVLLLVLQQIIVPLIILIVVVIVLAFVVKRVFGIEAPRAIGKAVTAIGAPVAKKGVGWFEKLLGGR